MSKTRLPEIQEISRQSYELRPAVISSGGTSAPTGQARILGNFFGDGCLFLRDRSTTTMSADDCAFPNNKYRELSACTELFTYVDQADWDAKFQRAVEMRATEIVDYSRESGANVLVSCSGSLVNLSAGARAAHELGVPLVAYLFDDPLIQWQEPIRSYLGRTELSWASQCAAAIVPNSALAESVWNRLGIVSHVVPNAVSDACFSENDTYSLRDSNLVRIIYTGSVYEAQADAVVRLSTALDTLDDRFRLELFTAQSEDSLSRFNVTGSRLIRNNHEEGDRVYAHQQNADILFLPLALESPFPQIIATAAPAKLGEFLASGRPLLVHAPADSFVARFVAYHHCGLVVSELSVPSLASALSKLADDQELRERIGRAARRTAEMFRLNVCRAKLWHLLAQIVFVHRLRDESCERPASVEKLQVDAGSFSIGRT